MSRIFISYSSKSKELVRRRLQMIWRCWVIKSGSITISPVGRRGGIKFSTTFASRDLFVFALTPDALDSHPCSLEYGYAHQLRQNILPILVSDGVSVNLLPPELSAIQYVDYRNQDRASALRLMNALNNLPALVPMPDPLPESPPVRFRTSAN